MSPEPAAKKYKVTGDEKMEWKLTFDQTQGLRTLVEVVGNILTRINFRLTYDSKKDMHFLCIDSIDPQHVCMIQARLVCEKTFIESTDLDFCVDSSIFNLILKSIPSHYSLDMVKTKDSADIHLSAYETLSNSHYTSFEMPTLVDDSETMQLFDMSYKYTIEIDLGTLRQIVKMSMSLRATDLTFSVKQNEEASDILRTTFTVGSYGDAKQEHHFHSATMTDKEISEGYVIRAATDSSTPESKSTNMKLVYRDAFSAQYLNFFLKNMERQIITMKLSPEKPLIVHYPLGADKSYICFVLAPKTEG